jgi:hypothetical protein
VLVYEYFKVRKLLTIYFNVGLLSANSALCVPYGKCSVSLHGTLTYRVESALSLCTIHISDAPSAECSVPCKVHIYDVPSEKCCFCAQYTFLMYCLESVLGMCTVYIFDIPSDKYSVCVHSTYF